MRRVHRINSASFRRVAEKSESTKASPFSCALWRQNGRFKEVPITEKAEGGKGVAQEARVVMQDPDDEVAFLENSRRRLERDRGQVDITL